MLGGELGLSFRFKPQAPLYFFGGAAFKHFSDYADHLETGGVLEDLIQNIVPMRIPLALCAVLAVTANAQTPPSVAFNVGFRNFGVRLTDGPAEFQYANSMEFEIRGEKSISRRFGVMLAGQFAPNSAQKADGGLNAGIFKSLVAYGGEAGLSFRFKPRAPIYFYAGPAYTRFSKYADPFEPAVSVGEWGIAYGFGIDRTVAGDYNARLQISLNRMYPGEPVLRPNAGGALVGSRDEKKSSTNDLRVGVGVRRAF